MLPELTHELAEALDDAVADVLDRAQIAEPPVDARAVAAALRLVVAWDERLSGRARFVRMPARRRGEAQGSILLRPEPRLERLQWAIAHEIGEELCGPIFSRLGVDPDEAPAAMRESVANLLAGRLLLPTAWLAADAQECDGELPALKLRYATASHELIARRLLELRSMIIISVFDHGSLTWRRGNGPNRTPPLSPLERACWQEAYRTGQPIRREGLGLVVQAWPIHEPGWAREILRTRQADGADCEPVS